MAAAEHSTNVVRLPTAAPREVCQPTRKHLHAFREANPWPGEFISPHNRAAQELTEGRSEATLMALAIFAALSSEQKAAARRVVDSIVDCSGDPVSRRTSLILGGVK